MVIARQVSDVLEAPGYDDHAPRASR